MHNARGEKGQFSSGRYKGREAKQRPSDIPLVDFANFSAAYLDIMQNVLLLPNIH